jgi:hypothetical protein
VVLCFSLSQCSVLILFLFIRSFCLATRAFSASSSLNDGSRNARNVSHGSSLHKPQCSRCFLVTQQLYNGQDSTFIIAVQNGLPSWCPHPRHFVPKCSHAPQNKPHIAAKLLSTKTFHQFILYEGVLSRNTYINIKNPIKNSTIFTVFFFFIMLSQYGFPEKDYGVILHGF